MYKFLCALVRAFMSVIFRIKIEGRENIPKDGGCILCANHLSNWDPPLLQSFVGRHIYYMAKDELFHVFGLGWLLKKIDAIPVKRTSADFSAIKCAIKTVKGGNILGIFPTGQRSLKRGEGEVKAGIGLLAGRTLVPVVPINISANYKFFSKITVRIGKPAVYGANDGEKLSGEVIERISNDIYNEIKKLSGVK